MIQIGPYKPRYVICGNSGDQGCEQESVANKYMVSEQ